MNSYRKVITKPDKYSQLKKQMVVTSDKEAHRMSKTYHNYYFWFGRM